MDRPNFVQLCLLADEFQRLSPPTAPAVRLDEIELVDEGIASQILQAVAKAEHDVTNRSRGVEDQPGLPE